VCAGAVVLGAVGFGLGLIAAPVIAIADPGVMPGAVHVVNATLPLFTLAAEWRRIDWRGLGWAMLGRLPGSVVGGLIVVYVSTAVLGALVGAMVLVAVVLTARVPVVPRTRGTLAGAGFVSGVTGTATGIGGPPMALVYQNAAGPQIRATLAAFFHLSAVQSLLLLTVIGELPARALAVGAALVPCLAAGFALAGPLRRHLDAGRVRAAVLVVAGVSAAVLITQSISG
jgi:uncharacterized membrane protein YfcA